MHVCVHAEDVFICSTWKKLCARVCVCVHSSLFIGRTWNVSNCHEYLLLQIYEHMYFVRVCAHGVPGGSVSGYIQIKWFWKGQHFAVVWHYVRVASAGGREKRKGCIILSFFAKSFLHSTYGNLEYLVKGKGTSFLNEDWKEKVYNNDEGQFSFNSYICVHRKKSGFLGDLLINAKLGGKSVFQFLCICI